MVRVFGGFYAMIVIMIMVFWVFVVTSIIRSIKTQNRAKNEVFKVANDVLRTVHTGNPRNPYAGSESTGQDDGNKYDDVFKKRDSDTFDSDLNPKTHTQRVYRTNRTVNRRNVRDSKVYSINSQDRPAHGKLSRESRDDEKEWF